MSIRAEKLKIVFCVQSVQGPDILIGDRNFQQVIPVSEISDKRKFELIVKSMELFEIPLQFTNSDGQSFSAEQIRKLLNSKNRWGHSLQAGDLKFRVGSIPAMNQSFVLIEEMQAGAAQSWDDWVAPFLDEPSFVQAWISDVDYDFWQNASDPIEYQALGRDFEHLQLKPNGLPAPLDQLMIDTSKNPGRWKMHVGFVEAIGSPMWLGPNLWKAVGKNLGQFSIDPSMFDVSFVNEGIIKVTSSIGELNSEDTSVVQNSLRTSLYGMGAE